MYTTRQELQVNNLNEYKYKHSQQNNSKSILIEHENVHTVRSSVIYLWCKDNSTYAMR